MVDVYIRLRGKGCLIKRLNIGQQANAIGRCDTIDPVEDSTDIACELWTKGETDWSFEVCTIVISREITFINNKELIMAKVIPEWVINF